MQDCAYGAMAAGLEVIQPLLDAVRKPPPFSSLFILKNDILPRQARDKHTRKPQEREREREWCVSRMQGVVDIALTSLQAYMEMPDPSECSVRKNATFCAIHVLKRTFYQDRLGTSIGKTQKKSGVFLFR
eukprot:COSAG06_NODE_310_length_17775_cov_9.971374_25_plen_130_part_00